MSEKFKRKSCVTLPVFSFKKRTEAFLRIDSEIREGKDIKQDGKKSKKPAKVCQAVDLETGEMVTFIVPTVVEGSLNDWADETGDTYVGKCFEIQKLPRREGKAYDDYRIYEIEA